MKHSPVVTGLLSLLLIVIIWIPSTRIFLKGDTLEDILILLIALGLVIGSVFSFRITKGKFYLLTMMIGFSPAVFAVWTMFGVGLV